MAEFLSSLVQDFIEEPAYEHCLHHVAADS